MTNTRQVTLALLACLAVLALPFCSRGITNDVIINEFMAVNDSTRASALGVYYDWIELYNNTPDDVDLTGWCLTDSPGDLTRWRFPATNINAYNYLVVYASGSNGIIAGELHADFKLGSSGDYLALVHPDGAAVAYEYTPKYPKQYSDISYGIAWGTTGAVERYLCAPTPGAANSNAFLTSEVSFSAPRGFYTAAFQLALSNDTPAAAIYYTINGTEPTTNSALYTGALAISATKVIRAMASRSGYDPSMVVTHTYIFPGDIIASSNMSTAITQDPVYGPQMTNSLLALPTLSVATETTDINWTPELKASVELILPDGGEGFHVNAGVRRYGNLAQSFAKRMFRLYFRSEYGSSRLEYPLFKGFEHGIEAVETFNRLDVRSGSQDMVDRGFYMSESWADDTLREMGKLNVHGRFIHVYINGNYWGVYYIHERWEADMMAQYMGGVAEDYESVSGDSWDPYVDPPFSQGSQWQLRDGDGSAWLRAISLATSYHQIEPYVDVANLFDFMMVFCMGTCEPEFYAAGPVNAGTGFKFKMKDPDGLLRLGGVPVTDTGPAQIISKLDAEGDPDFEVMRADRIYKHFFHDGALTTNRCADRLIERCNEFELPFLAESARWSYRSPSSWNTEKNTALGKFNTRPVALLNDLRSAGMYPLDAPEYNQHGGMFTNTFLLTMTGPGGATIYYTLDGSDPRQSGTGNAVGTEYSGAISLGRTTLVKARAKNGSTWSALNEVVFVLDTPSTLRVTELMYNPRDSAWGMGNSTNFEFIEFQNAGTQTIGLAGIEVTSGVRFDFTEGSALTLDPGKYVLLVNNMVAFTNRYAGWAGMNIAGEFHGQYCRPVGSLDNGGENITVVDGLGRIVQSFDYEDDWYPCTDGEGFSLTIIDPNGSTNSWNTKLGWRYSAYVDGSPGTNDSTSVLYQPGSIVINEALTHQDIEPPGDWIELRNTTASPINIGDWYLSDGELDLRRFRIPASTVIPANGYVVFTESSDFGTNVLGTNGFALSEWGDSIYLSAGSGGALAQPAYRETVDFDTADRDVTFGRYVKSDGLADFTAMSAPTTNAINAYPKVGPVVISEIMYNPTNGQNEFIELANVSGATAPLYDPLNPTNTWKVGGVNFKFPTNITIGTSVVILVQDTISPSAFRASNNVPAGAQIFNYTGTLDSAGEKISLKKPLAPDELGVAYADVDVVKYNNKAPWPILADGYGYSLERINPTLYGNDAVNWTTNAVGGTPGVARKTVPTTPLIFVTPGPINIATPENVAASNQTFDVRNIGVATLAYSIRDDSAWLGATVTNGSSSGASDVRTHSIAFSTTSLAVGRYNAVMTVVSTNAGNSPVPFDVNLEITEREKIPPYVDKVISTNSRQIKVLFDETVQAGSGANGAEKTANYTVDNGVSISGAVLGGDNKTVILSTVSAMSEGTDYKLVVRNVADRAPIPNPIVGALTNIFRYVLNNTAPIAEAGTNQTGYIQTVTTLNGSASYDPDSKPLSLRYAWSQTSGPYVTIYNSDSAVATFTATDAGDYEFQLEVFDGADVGTDSVSVSVLFANTVPYAESFENYYNGFELIGYNSWYASVPDAATVLVNSYTNTYKGTFPISGRHRLALDVYGSLTNVFKNTGSYTNIWFDMMLEGVRWAGENPPSPDSDVQFAAYVNSGGQICVWNKRGSSNAWTTLTQTQIGTNEWFRLAIQADYASNPCRFRIYTNGIAVTNTGAWFDFARTNNHYFSLVGFAGDAYVDDLVVTDSDMLSAFVIWLTQYYSATNDYNEVAASDTDGDGMTAEEEYYAGTIPTDGNSIMKIMKTEQGESGQRIYWRSVTGRYYSVYKSTNLLKGWLSQPLTSSCWGVAGGTNIFDAAANTNAAAFYKITTIKP